MLKAIDSFFILLALAVFTWGVNRRMKLWRIGTKDFRSNKMWLRIKSFLLDGIAHRRILQDLYPGTLHLLIFFGFFMPLAIIVITQVTFTIPLFAARLLSLFLDIMALAIISAVILALFCRYITRPSRLDNRPDDLLSLVLLLVIPLTGIIFEGLRLSIIGRDIKAWAPIGYAFSSLIQLTGLSIHAKGILAMVFFRIHFLLVLVTIAYIPFSKLFHIVSSPLNMIFRSLEPKGALSHINFEEESIESFGISKIEEFSWKQLMDLDACTRCGRCQDHCPAYLSQKPLSPKKVITDLKDHLSIRAPQILGARSQGKEVEPAPPLVGQTIEEDVLWACTTCRSCMEHCPVYIEHIDKIVDMRRYQVLMEGKFPEELTTAFKGLERNSNPWGLGFEARADWVSELDVPIMSEINKEEIEFLFFVGCIRSYDDRNKKVAIAMAKILQHLGVRFAILGMEEGCCGDPARRVGNEYLYQSLAQNNIEVFNRYGIEKILTTCPHCFNTFRNEYPQLGFDCEVTHHTVFLEECINNGRLKFHNALTKKITYHDPCYLGRYSGIYEPPRRVIEAIPSLDLLEIRQSRIDSLCCGAGGGWMWMDEKIGKRLNAQRLENALTTHPEWIATACPFCITMFDDAIKDKSMENEIKIWDIAELVEQAIFGDKKG